jgi:hypothetical protein
MRMTVDHLLALIGILIGLPGFMILFFNGQVVAGFLVVVMIAGIIWVRWLQTQLDFTLLEVTKTLTFHDVTGHEATLIRRQTARANHKGLIQFTIKGITSDGVIDNILIDGKPPHEQFTEAGRIGVRKHFSKPLDRGDIDDMELTYDITDGFNKATETSAHKVAYKTDKVKLIVIFHPNRPCFNPRASLRFGGNLYKNLTGLKVIGNNARIEIEIKKPKIGSDCYIEWDW